MKKHIPPSKSHSQDVSPKSLSQYVDLLQSLGHYSLKREMAIDELGLSSSNFNMSVSRLMKKGRVINAKQGFYVIVPLEYENAGGIPASWFIDDLMSYYPPSSYHLRSYYVGLLSAAALHGAAHQQPQEFQVITDETWRPIIVGRTQIRFFLKKEIKSAFPFITQIKTPTGYMLVSSPELTVVDLLKYINAVGQINNVATIIAELAEKIDGKKLLEVAAKTELPIVQRAGYLLDTFAGNGKTEFLYQWFCKEKATFASLVPGVSRENAKKNQKWKLWINEKIEVDE